MSDELSIDDLNFTPLTKAGAQGKREPRKPLPQMKTWKNCTVKALRRLALSAFDLEKENPPTARLQLVIDTHGQYEDDVMVYFNWWEGANPNSKSIWHQINCAIWPDEGNREGKTPADMIGEQVNVQTMPSDKDPKKTRVVLQPAG